MSDTKRNFSDEADYVRGCPCLVAIKQGVAWHSEWGECCGDVEPAHIRSRGAGGGRFDIIPLCAKHHTEQHQLGIESFAVKYGLDLRLEADRIALEHAAPLGILGLGTRWERDQDARRKGYQAGDARCPKCWAQHPACDVGNACCYCGESRFVRQDEAARPLDTYERDALLGWVRRRMEREVKARRLAALRPCSAACPGAPAVDDGLAIDDREALAHAVMLGLGEPLTSDPSGEHGLAWALCEAAGWPS